jgi:hypothetical protein
MKRFFSFFNRQKRSVPNRLSIVFFGFSNMLDKFLQPLGVELSTFGLGDRGIPVRVLTNGE